MADLDRPPDRRSLLARATQRLREAGVASPDFDAAELLAHVLGTERSRLVLVDEVRPRMPNGTPTSWTAGRPASRCST